MLPSELNVHVNITSILRVVSPLVGHLLVSLVVLPLLVDRRADVAPHEVLVFVPALEVQGSLVESTSSMSYFREKNYEQMVKRILKQMLMERWTNSAQYGTTPGAC